MITQIPSTDNLLLHWPVPGWLYIYRVYLRSWKLTIFWLLSGPAGLFLGFYFHDFIPFLLVVFYSFFIYFFVFTYIIVHLFFMFLSIFSPLDQEFFITDNGIYLLPKSFFSIAKNFFKLSGVSNNINDKMLSLERLGYNYTGWDNIKEIIINNKIGLITLKEKKFNANKSIGFLVASSDVFPDVLKLVKQHSSTALIKEK